MSEFPNSKLSFYIRAIRKGLIWLESQQKINGRWKEESLVLAVTTTSQVATTFLRAGFPITDKVLAKALSWLLGKDVESKVTHKFWRLLPFLEVEEFYGEQIRSDLNYLIGSIESGLKIDPDLNYSLFLLDCLLGSSIKSEFDISENIAAAERELKKTSSRGIIGSLWAYRVLESHGHKLSSEVLNSISVSFLSQIQTQSSVSHYAGSVAATSYCIINICRSPAMRSLHSFSRIVDECAEWLLSQQVKHSFWQQERSLYGGNPGSCYTTAIALRALIEYLFYKKQTAIVAVFYPGWKVIRVLRFFVKIGLGSLALISLAAALVMATKNVQLVYIIFSVITGLASLASLWLSWKSLQ